MTSKFPGQEPKGRYSPAEDAECSNKTCQTRGCERNPTRLTKFTCGHSIRLCEDCFTTRFCRCPCGLPNATRKTSTSAGDTDYTDGCQGTPTKVAKFTCGHSIRLCKECYTNNYYFLSCPFGDRQGTRTIATSKGWV